MNWYVYCAMCWVVASLQSVPTLATTLELPKEMRQRIERLQALAKQGRVANAGTRLLADDIYRWAAASLAEHGADEIVATLKGAGLPVRDESKLTSADRRRAVAEAVDAPVVVNAVTWRGGDARSELLVLRVDQLTRYQSAALYFASVAPVAVAKRDSHVRTYDLNQWRHTIGQPLAYTFHGLVQGSSTAAWPDIVLSARELHQVVDPPRTAVAQLHLEQPANAEAAGAVSVVGERYWRPVDDIVYDASAHILRVRHPAGPSASAVVTEEVQLAYGAAWAQRGAVPDSRTPTSPPTPQSIEPGPK